jgi:adenine deaminase
MGNMGALEVATPHGAHFLGLDGELGSLTSGKVADVLVLSANPLDDIKNTTRIKYVVKNGIVWDASTLDEVWPNAKPYGDYPWVDPDALRTDDRPVTFFDKEPGRSYP